MINNILDVIFTSTGNLAVLRVLNEKVTGISGRETARLAGIGLRSVQLALENLVDLKIVNVQIGGRENLYTLNRKNFISNEVITKLFWAEKKYKKSLFNKISDSLKNHTDSIILFGSVARKEESTESDLDICIVYHNSKTNIENTVNSLRDELFNEYGVKLAPLYITRAKFKKNINKSPVREIIKDGIVISGEKIKSLLNG